MNKLGFAIKRVSQGAGNVIECNKGQWTNKVVDVREYLKLFNGLQGTDNIVTFISFDECGCFLTQLRAITGRAGDFLSGWIYIPSAIEISSSEVMNAYNKVGEILSKSNLNDLSEDINDFFSKEYPLNNYSARYSPSHGEKFGVRYIGHYNLKEILDNRYQSYYSEFKAIFLLKKDGAVSITKEHSQSLSLNYIENDITKSAILIPPTPQELQEVGIGTRIITTTGKEFKEPMFVSIDFKGTFILHRDGFEDIKLPTCVTSEQQKLCIPTPIEWKKKISASMFKICNDNDKDIRNVVTKIRVDDNDITNNDILISEDKCKNAIVEISAYEYELYQKPMNLLLRSPYYATLTRKNKYFQSVIELANGKDGKITIESKYITSEYDSPLEAYTHDRDRDGDRLRISLSFIWKQRIYGFLTALIIYIAFMGYVSIDSFFDTYHLKFGWPPYAKNVVESTPPKDSVPVEIDIDKDKENDKENALNYIKENQKLEKNKLESYEFTKGLYDMINKYNFNGIVKLSSEYDSTVISDVKKSSQKMINANKTMTGTFSNDGSITIQKWIDKINGKSQEMEIPDSNPERREKTSGKGPKAKKPESNGKQNNTNETNTNSQKNNPNSNKDESKNGNL